MTSVNGTQRYFIGTATTAHAALPDLADKPELATALNDMRELFVGRLGYKDAPGFRPDMSSAELRGALGRFLTDHQRSDRDVVAFYYTGHAKIDNGDYILPL